MATVTASNYGREPKALHAGTNTIVGVYNTTLSTGDILKMAKIPDRAVIVAAGLQRDEGGGDLIARLNIPMVGASGTASTTTTAMLTSTASGSVAMLPAFLGYQISISDAVIVKEVDLEIVNASASTTPPIRWFIQYTLDGTP